MKKHILLRFEMLIGSLLAWATFGLSIVCYIVPCFLLDKIRYNDKEKCRGRSIARMQKIALLPLQILPKVSYHLQNFSKESFKKQAIYICNHKSIFDILLCLSLCNKLLVVVKSSYNRSLFIKTMVKIHGYHFLSSDPYDFFNLIAADIEKGYSLLIFPEGTRSSNLQVGKFLPGAFIIARYFNLDILPLCEKGLESILPKGKLIAKQGNVSLSVFPRFSQSDTLLSNKTTRKQAQMFEQYYHYLLTSKESVCIIGGGMGGLFTGAILSKIGYQVTILEKNKQIGGGLQSFERNKVIFNPGMHNFGGWHNKWFFSHLLTFLEIKDSLHILPTDEKAQEIVWTDTKHAYCLPKGRERFEQYLSNIFPNQQIGLHSFLDILFHIADSFDHVFMRQSVPHPEVNEYVDITIDTLIRKYITDEELIRIFNAITFLCGNNIRVTPVTIYSLIMMLYIDGIYRFIGNASQLASALSDSIRQRGGVIHTNTHVNNIQIEANNVSSVNSEDGKLWKANKYIIAIPPKQALPLLSNKIMRKVTINRINTFIPKCSLFSIFIKLKKQVFPFINSVIFIPTESENNELPEYLLMHTPPHDNQNEYASTIEILVPMTFHSFKQWNDTYTMNRDKDYENYKKEISKNIIKHISQYYNLQDAIDSVFTASPLTIRDYYNNPNGAVFAQQGLYIPIQTRVPNLFFTGQSVHFHGLFGVPITAILTAETLSNTNILEQLKNIET